MSTEQAVRVADAGRNVSGVERDAGAVGEAGNLFTIRGITLDTFNSYYRDGFRYEGGTPTEVASVEQFEILKGPASMIYGRTEPGGIVNLVTVRPLSQAQSTVTVQADRFGVVRPQIDSTGALTPSGNLLYRVVGLYGHQEGFRDFVTGNRYFLSPQFLWKISPDTSLSIEGEYLHDKSVTDFGIPAVGDGPAPIPISRFLGEPWGRAKYQGKWAGATFNHQFTPNWSLRDGFRATFFNWDFYDVYAVFLLPDNRTLARGVEDANYPRRFFDNQTDVTGTFATGALRHTLLAGFEAGTQKIRQYIPFGDVPSIDIYDPVYASLTRPPSSTYIPPGSIFDAQQRFTSYGGYAQDQIAFGKFAINAAVRVENYRQRFQDFGAGTSVPQVDTRAVPRIGGVYHVTPEVSLYASYSQSFSPAVATLRNETGQPFKPSLGSQYEGGLRWSFASGRLFFTAAGYRIHVSNVLTADPGNPLNAIQSGVQESKGLELDLNGTVAAGWNLLLNYTYTHATVVSDNTFPVGNLLPDAPRHAANLWTVYEIQRGPLAGLGFGGGVFARGRRVGELTNSYFLPGYARLDATAFYSFGSAKNDLRRFRLSVNIQNLSDRTYYESGRSTTVIFPGAPISVVSALQIRF
jgi:iron complex outermembrane receptor protein